MRRQALVVALLLVGCDDPKFDPSPMQPIARVAGDDAPQARPVPPGPPVPKPPPPLPEPVAVPEAPPPLPTTGAFSLSLFISSDPAKKTVRGGVKDTTAWTSTVVTGGKGGPEAEVRTGALGKDAAALFARLDALSWHVLPSGSGTSDGSHAVVTVSRGEVSHSFSVEGACDCPAGEAVAAISKALARLPVVKVATAVVNPAGQAVKNGSRVVEAECQLGACTPRGSKAPQPYVCYPTKVPNIQNCLDSPWKLKGFLVKTAGKMSLEPGRRPWAMVLGKNTPCEMNAARSAWVCRDSRVVREVLSGGKTWFAVFEEGQAPEPLSKVFLLPTSTP